MLTDFLKSFAIVTLATAALATPALATDMSFTATKDGAVSIADLTNNATNTVLLIDTTEVSVADGVETIVDNDPTVFTGTVTEDMIVHIDETAFTVEEDGKVYLNVQTLKENHRYELRIGGLDASGNGVTLQSDVFVLQAGQTDITYNLSTQTGDDKGNLGAKQFYADCERVLGNVDDTAGITLGDVNTILYHYTNIGVLTGEKLQAADANNDGSVSLGDVNGTLYYYTNIDTVTVNGTTTVGKKTADYITETNADGSDLTVTK